MANTKNNCAAIETRRKLIDAAGEIFAQQGLESTTIQDITQRAGTSLAAVNYHFEDKVHLYQHVIAEAYRVTTSIFRQMPIGCSQTPEQQFQNFIASILKLMNNADHTYWHCALLTRDIQQHDQRAQKQLVELVQVVNASLGQIIANMIGHPISDTDLVLCASCVMGLCKYFVEHQDFHAKIYTGMPLLKEDPQQLTDYVTRFSIAAIRTMYGDDPIVPHGHAASRPHGM